MDGTALIRAAFWVCVPLFGVCLAVLGRAPATEVLGCAALASSAFLSWHAHAIGAEMGEKLAYGGVLAALVLLFAFQLL